MTSLTRTPFKPAVSVTVAGAGRRRLQQEPADESDPQPADAGAAEEAENPKAMNSSAITLPTAAAALCGSHCSSPATR